jgi:hypothetical protein
MDASRMVSTFFAALLLGGIVMRLLEVYGAWLVEVLPAPSAVTPAPLAGAPQPRAAHASPRCSPLPLAPPVCLLSPPPAPPAALPPALSPPD